MHKINSLLSSLFVIFFFSPLFGVEETPLGTLIVTYQTDQSAEKLERLKFWLKDENNKIDIYPKGENFVDDKDSNSRTVVIKNLALGAYTLHFLIPNKDHFFKNVPEKQVLIQNQDPIKVDIKIKQNINQ